MRIWKYPLAVVDCQFLNLPMGAQVLTVQVQNGSPCLWAQVDETEADTERRGIAIHGTGNPMPDDPGRYIATFQMAGGDLVFHAFEI